MRHGVWGASLVLALGFTVAATAADKKPRQPESREKLLASGALTGTLTQVEPTAQWLTLRVTQKVPVRNVGAEQNLASLQQQLLQQATNKNLVDRANQVARIQREIADNRANLVTYQDKNQEFELQAADEIKVRQAHPPVAFDDKGRPKKYTQKELLALKGKDRKLPGYPSDFDNLRSGQKVKVYLARKKDAGKTSTKDGDKEGTRRRLTVTLIVIEQDAPK